MAKARRYGDYPKWLRREGERHGGEWGALLKDAADYIEELEAKVERKKRRVGTK